ncbi:hypothetical protein V8B97DRAFT_1917546 [Scleroderma yunnanense]
MPFANHVLDNLPPDELMIWVNGVWYHGDIIHGVLTSLEHAYDHVCSVGFVLPNIEVRLTCEENGEMQIDIEGGGKGPDRHEASITSNRWFKTSDIAQCDKDGFFISVDRRKELIKCKVRLLLPRCDPVLLVPPAQLESVLS